MKRYFVLALLLLIAVASISGTNAAYMKQVALPSDKVILATPTPSSTPVPTATPGPTPTPAPQPWTGEFELVIWFDSVWRAQKPERHLGNIRLQLLNHTGSGHIPAVNIKKWEVGLSANFSFDSMFNGTLNKLASNRYSFTSMSWDSAVPQGSSTELGGGASSYELVKEINKVKTRTTNPTLHQLVFSNATLSINSGNYDDPLIRLAPNRLKITYIVPAPLTGWNAEWENGVVYPPGWSLVH